MTGENILGIIGFVGFAYVFWTLSKMSRPTPRERPAPTKAYDDDGEAIPGARTVMDGEGDRVYTVDE